MAKSRPRRRQPSRPTLHPENRVVNRPLFYGGMDPIELNRMETLVSNLRTLEEVRTRQRAEMDRRRDIAKECGYPDSVSLQEYRDLIDSEPLAGLVNAIYPLETWEEDPEVYEVEESDTETEFETAWNELPKMLNAEPTHYAMEEGNAIYEALLTADLLAGYGRYSVILLGFDDLKKGEDLSTPAVPQAGKKLIYVRPFPEYLAKIETFDTEERSPRFGQPISYLITFSDPKGTVTDEVDMGISESSTTKSVHFSRIVHITDRWHDASSSLIYGKPRLQPVLPAVLDTRKVRASSAEMYYLGAFFGLHFGTHPQLGPDVDVDRESLRDMYEEYKNGLQRALFTSGMTVDPLAPSVVDPTPQIKVQVESVCIRMRVPMRIMVGSERGELASGDDKKKWNGRKKSRKSKHNTARVLVPFTDRLINQGVLPLPKKGYCVDWPSTEMESPLERAQTLLAKTQAYGVYVSQGVEQVVPPQEYMTKFDDMTDEEAAAMLEAVPAIPADSFTIDEPPPDPVIAPPGTGGTGGSS